MTRKTILKTTLLACAAVPVSAVSPIKPFVGDVFEGFESIQSPGPHMGPMPIFSGASTFDDEFTDPWITFNLSGPGGEIVPFNGNLMGLNPTGWTVFEFEEPVVRFGGYMGLVNENQGGSVSFFDAQGALIETLSFSLPVGQWEWHGWESDVPMARIVIHPSENPGTTAVYDDLQASFPAALLGDMNCDGQISVTDIGAFVLALTDAAGYAAQFPNCDINNGDLNNDGQVSVGDIGQFVLLLTGG